MLTYNEIRENTYFDSVTLMVISSKISEIEGIKNAAVMMGTDHNKDLMKNSNLLLPENENVGTNDLIIGILAEKQEAIDLALKAIEDSFNNKKVTNDSSELRVKTLDSAVKR